jgi:hypothetical protein
LSRIKSTVPDSNRRRRDTEFCVIRKHTAECHKRKGCDGNRFAGSSAMPPKHPPVAGVTFCLVLSRLEVIVPVPSALMIIR